MMASFRGQVLAVCIAAATIPALMLAPPIVSRLSSSMRHDAETNARLAAEKEAARIDRAVELIANRAAAVARDSDVRRAGRVPIFISKADIILRSFLKDNPAVTEVFYLDEHQKTLTGAPDGIDLRIKEGDVKKLRDVASLALPAGRQFGMVAPDDAGLIIKVPVHALPQEDAPNAKSDLAALVVMLPWSSLRATEIQRVGASTSLDAKQWITKIPLLTTPELALLDPSKPGFELAMSADADALFRGARQSYRLLCLVTGLSIIALALAALALARSLIRPLTMLHDFVSEYAVGNYKATPPRLKQKELQDITAQLESMSKRVMSDMAATVAELEALKSQLKPHFLFNALNSIAALVHDGGKDAQLMLAKLAELYRMILASSQHATHTLGAELDVVRNYLDLESLRLSGRLTYRIATDGAKLDAHVPCLLLQTLVENCIKHGVAPAIDGGTIELTVSSQGGSTQIRLTNTGRSLRPDYKFGTGLSNTVRRLDLFAPGAHAFNIKSDDDGATLVSFTLPGKL